MQGSYLGKKRVYRGAVETKRIYVPFLIQNTSKEAAPRLTTA
jgi:hypothetical protein